MSEASGEQQTTAARPAEVIRTRIAELERKIGTMDDRRQANRRIRAESGPPNGTSDGRALADLRGEALRLELEQEDMQAWLAQARLDLASAEHAELVAADVELAKRRLELAAAFRRVGGLLDEALTPTRCFAWLSIAQELRLVRLSSETYAVGPTDQQVRVLGLQALQTQLMETPWSHEFRTLAPCDRRSFQSLSDGWAAMAEKSAREFLSKAGVELETPVAAE
jgi:hypothetical protein